METSGKTGSGGSFTPIIIVMIASLIIAFLWDTLEFIKNTVHAILNPTAGVLLNWNVTWGMMIIVAFLSLLITIIQKYATDQKTLKEMKNEQKRLNEEAKKFRDNPEKMMEIQKESMKFAMPMMKLSMRALIFTGIHFILFFRWFNDFFISIGSPKFFGIMGWLIFYLIFSIVFSSIFRKILKVV